MSAAERSLDVSWHDPVALRDIARSMAGLEFLRGIVAGEIPRAPIQELVGFDLTVETGEVRAEGTVVHRGRTVATSEATLTGPDGKLLAHGTSTCMIFESD